MIIAKVVDVSIFIKNEEGERLMLFTDEGFCNIISVHDVREIISSGKRINKEIAFEKEILNLELELGQQVIKLCEFNSKGEIIFFDASFLSELIKNSYEKYISLASFAEKHDISKSSAKKKAANGEISGIIPIYSPSGRISAYVVPENAEVL